VRSLFLLVIYRIFSERDQSCQTKFFFHPAREGEWQFPLMPLSLIHFSWPTKTTHVYLLERRCKPPLKGKGRNQYLDKAPAGRLAALSEAQIRNNMAARAVWVITDPLLVRTTSIQSAIILPNIRLVSWRLDMA